MAAVPPHLYRREGLARGLADDLVRRAADERSRQQQLGLEPILTLGHLSHLTGASYRYLREIVERRRDPYVDIAQRKRSGGVRPISSPDPVLMEVQRWLLRNALKTIKLHDACYAYRSGRSVVECARQHLGARWLVKLDLHNFFGTVDEHRTFGVFRSVGYGPLVSFELARLVTRTARPVVDGDRVGARESAIPAYQVAPRGRLPQGAPTSGAIANAAATTLDESLARIASELGWAYTRYSDDLTFSTDVADRESARRLIAASREAVLHAGFVLHAKKTRVVPPGSRHIVLGLLVDDDSLRLLPEFKRRIEVHVRGVSTFGLGSHVDRRRFRSVFSFISHIDGSLAFAQSVDPLWAERVRARWTSALLDSGFPQ